MILDQSLGFSGTIAGFGSGDTLDLGDITAGVNATLAYIPNAAGTGALSRERRRRHASIALLGQYAASAFVASAATESNQLITPTA